MKYGLPAILLFTFLIPAVFSCKCLPPKFNETMCEAKWVSHVHVLSNETTVDGLQLNYTVKHLETFKSPNGTTLVGQDRSVLTPFHDATCGVNSLQTSEDYLLTGTVDVHDQFHINLCLGVPLDDGKFNHLGLGYIPWEAVPEAMRKRLQRWAAEEEEKC